MPLWIVVGLVVVGWPSFAFAACILIGHLARANHRTPHEREQYLTVARDHEDTPQ